MTTSPPKIQIPLSSITTTSLPASIHQSLTTHLLQHTSAIPNLLAALQTLATETGFSERVTARVREIAERDEAGDGMTAEEVKRRVIGEIIARMGEEGKQGDGEKDQKEGEGEEERAVSPDEKTEEKAGVEMPREMIETARRIVREGLEQVVEIEVREEREARENGWV